MNKDTPAQESVKSLEELVVLLDTLRAKKKKIVHCHGVFDPLHIGHILHFEQAKRMGDILVVTVTPDEYVNKGPHRPVFPGTMRANSIAALNFVDYVAINRWPTAVETVRMLKPDLFVKGAEYKGSEKDETGAINEEEAAVRAVGGELAFTEGLIFSSSRLVNHNLDLFPPKVCSYLADFTSRRNVDEVLKYIAGIAKLKILVVGESIIDDYRYCEALGRSAKDPVLTLREITTERFAGGCLAVANHLAGCGAHVTILTALGDNPEEQDWIKSRLNSKIETRILTRTKARTIVKQRILDKYTFSKLLEVQILDDDLVSAQEDALFCAMLEKDLSTFDAVLAVDYGHGLVSSDAVEIICAGANFLTVNTQANASNHGYHTLSKYRRADLVSCTERELRLETRNRRSSAPEIIRQVAENGDYRMFIVTRGSMGSLAYEKGGELLEIPAVALQVRDRIGAGDALLSLASACAVQGAPLDIIGFVGNAVAAQAVATTGNQPPEAPTSLIRFIKSLLK